MDPARGGTPDGGAGGGVPGGAEAPPSNAVRTDCRLTPAAAAPAPGWTNAGSAATTETSPHGSSAATTSAGVLGPAPSAGCVHDAASPVEAVNVSLHSSSSSAGTSDRTADGGSARSSASCAGRGWIAAAEIHGTSSDGPAQRAVIA
ncbi:hypothetical protein [Cellulosimicrobium sp. Marseille-Q8652]